MEQTSPQSEKASAPNHGQNKMIMGVLAYLGILIVIPFMMAKDDPFVKFHIRQGLVLVVIEIGLWAIGMFTWQLWQILQLVNIGIVILAIIGIVNVLQNREQELPLIGSFAHNFNI